MTLDELKKIKEEMSLELIKLPTNERIALSKKWKEEWRIEREEYKRQKATQEMKVANS